MFRGKIYVVANEADERPALLPISEWRHLA
jgi:hypothetical protein